MERFAGSLVELALDIHHFTDDQFDLCLRGDRLASICSKLINLRSLHFFIIIQLKTKRESSLTNEYIDSFRTPVWLDGPWAFTQVAAFFDQIHGVIVMISLPFTFRSKRIVCTVDLLDMQFNNVPTRKQSPSDLAAALTSLWCRISRVEVRFAEKEYVPVLFLRTLQTSNGHGQSVSARLAEVRHRSVRQRTGSLWK